MTSNLCMTGKDITVGVHAGDKTAHEVYAHLAQHGGVLVDVRTPQEWAQGIPDLKETQGRVATISWKLLPEYNVNPDFAAQLAAEQGIDKDTPLFFMCKGGGRSLEAARAMTTAGYASCYNVLAGFEGKGEMPGWKTQLPWKQR